MQDAPFSIPGHAVVPLTAGDTAELQVLFEACSDYVEMFSGEPPASDEAESELRSHPPGRDLSDKLPLGVYDREGRLVGYLEFFRDYPAERGWWIGLLMLHPEVRNRGLGARLYEAASRWVERWGGRTIGIGVLEENPGALRFWKRLGFEEGRRDPFTSDAGKEHTMIVLSHRLRFGSHRDEAPPP